MEAKNVLETQDRRGSLSSCRENAQGGHASFLFFLTRFSLQKDDRFQNLLILLLSYKTGITKNVCVEVGSGRGNKMGWWFRVGETPCE